MRHILFSNFNRHQALTLAVMLASIAGIITWMALTTAAQ
jgi:hypothetical protein